MKDLNKLKKAELIELVESLREQLEDKEDSKKVKELENKIDELEDDINENYISNLDLYHMYTSNDELPEGIDNLKDLIEIGIKQPMTDYDKQDFARIVEKITNVKVQVLD